MPVPIEDRLTTNVGDGIGERLALIVPVSASNPRFEAALNQVRPPPPPETTRRLEDPPPTPSEVPTEASTEVLWYCEVPCVDYMQYKAKCSTTSKIEQCRRAVAWVSLAGATRAAQPSDACTQTFLDVQPFGSNSEFGLMSWVDDGMIIPMCGCAAGYEAAIVPFALQPGAVVGDSSCVVGVASPALVDIHNNFTFACAESSMPVPIAAIILSIILPTLVVALLFWYYSRRKMAKKLQALRGELEAFKDSVVGVRHVIESFDPREDEGFTFGEESPNHRQHKDRPAAKWPILATEAISDDSISANVLEEAEKEKEQLRIARAKWYWQEDEANIAKHNPIDVKQPGNFVSYAGSVCAELDQKYSDSRRGGELMVEVDLNDRIGSTGTEQKAHNQHTGVVFEIDFGAMLQRNKVSGFTRKILRVEHTPEAMVKVMEPAAAKSEWRRSTNAPSKTVPGKPHVQSKPDDIAQDDSLILHKGQLVQTSKQRPDGWAFGSVVLDVMEERPAISVDGMSTQAGWFPLACTDLPAPEQLSELQGKMGANANNALSPPPYWTPVADPLRPDIIALKDDSAEYRQVHGAFMKRSPNIKVISIERIQNTSMWQSYAVKRQTILEREKEDMSTAKVSRLERIWLFHGTDEVTVPKIVEMGFNRSFCGRNATRFGKGVYFARDASYSSSTTYSRPNSKGVQHMFVCRIVVGEFCQGRMDAPAPDVQWEPTLRLDGQQRPGSSDLCDVPHVSISRVYRKVQAVVHAVSSSARSLDADAAHRSSEW